MTKNKRYLIIGAGGLVGRHLASELGRDRSLPTYRRVAEPGGLVLDVTDHSETRRIVREQQPDVIIVAAADAYVERCEREPVATRQVNVDAVRAIADAANEIGATLVVFSSEYVFDGTAGEYSETDERRPLNEYGRQKVELENVAEATGRCLICRTSGVFGLDPRGRNFVLQLRDALRDARTFKVPSDQLITPTYAPWLAKAVVALVDGGHTGTFHVAGPRIMPRLSFARLIANAYGLSPGLVVGRTSLELGLIAKRPEKAGLAVRKLTTRLALDQIDPQSALALMAAADISQGTDR